MSEKDEPIQVYLVNPPIENPWRTHGDYIQEQKQNTIRFWVTTASLIVSIIGVAANVYPQPVDS